MKILWRVLFGVIVLVGPLAAAPQRGGTQSNDERSTIKRVEPQSSWEENQEEQDKAVPQHSTVVDVQFVGVKHLPLATQEELVEQVTGEHFEDAEIDERVRDAYQHLGYFLALVKSDVEVIGGAGTVPQVVLYITVREGELYTLREIRWKNITVFRTDDLRPLIPLQDGEVLDTLKIREGLNAIRKLYDSKGYINFVAIPDTQIDAATRAISLIIDADEGASFKVGSVRVLGGDMATREAFLMLVKPGDQYNPEFVERIFEEKLRPRLPEGREIYNVIEITRDDAAHTVGIIVDLRSMTD